MKFCSWTFVGLCLFLSLGCSSMHKRAEKQFESGLFDEAVATYQQILAKEPNDTDAQTGLLRAQNKLIETRLIQIRHLRLAGNQQDAIDSLLDLVLKEKRWKVFPKGSVAYTQNEESDGAFSFLRSQSRLALSKDMPLAADYLLEKYKPIFEGDRIGVHQLEVNKTFASGKKKCFRLKKGSSNNLSYYGLFLQKFCSHFGASSPATKTSKRFENLAGKIKIKLDVAGLPQSGRHAIKEQLKGVFRKTAWFHPKGQQTVKVTLSGSYRHKHDRSHESRVHQYSVRIPYTDYENVRKSRQVPYLTQERKCDYSYTLGETNCRYESVTRYRTEFYDEQQAVTRYRSEPRVQSYHGTRHHLEMTLALSGKVKWPGSKESLSWSDQLQQQGFEHSFNLPAMGLYPKRVALTDPGKWLEGQARNLGTKLSQQAGKVWDARYCRPAGGTVANAGDRVHQCLRNRLHSAPQFTQKWYEQHFGVNVVQANQLLGLEDL